MEAHKDHRVRCTVSFIKRDLFDYHLGQFNVIRCTLDASQLSRKSDLPQQTSLPVYNGIAIQHVV